jgi:hypothetical protein
MLTNTGKLAWYYQELPGDDWDADHNHERMLIHTRVAPDPRYVKWISSALRPGEEHDIVVTVAEGGDAHQLRQPLCAAVPHVGKSHRRDRLRGWAYRIRTLMCRENIHLFEKS